MLVSYVPVLPTLRELYAQPRSMDRFRAYIAQLTGGTDDVVLPIGQANPMARDQALDAVNRLIALGADGAGAEAADEAARRLARIPLTSEIKATIVVADDAGGGWTNRHTTEAMVRFPGRGALKRPFATALAWTSESPGVDELRAEVLAAIYRVAFQQQLRLPTTLGGMLQQEGLAARFANQLPTLTPEALDQARRLLAGLDRERAPYPTIFAALYGDAAATALGYPALGLPPRAGFEVAIADERRDPIEVLASGERS
jgi:hypothetical protein